MVAMCPQKAFVSIKKEPDIRVGVVLNLHNVREQDFPKANRHHPTIVSSETMGETTLVASSDLTEL